MRASLVFLTSALCATIYGYDPQQPLSSLDLYGNSYRCENGAKPSITCTDPSTDNHDCSCTCTNGVIFNQRLPLSSGAGGSSSSALMDCQAGKNECDEAKSACLQNHQQCMLALEDTQNQTSELLFESSVMCPRDHGKEVRVDGTLFRVWCHRFHQTIPYIGVSDVATLAECAKLCATNPKCTNLVHGMGHRACRLREGQYNAAQEPTARDNWHSLIKV